MITHYRTHCNTLKEYAADTKRIFDETEPAFEYKRELRSRGFDARVMKRVSRVTHANPNGQQYVSKNVTYLVEIVI